MTSRDLFEMASLDVLGLLDEQERAQFEEAFRSAPPHIQAQIRAEQLRATDVERILPQVEPPAGLRGRVLAAVREAIASVGSEPIARIGANGVASWSTAPIWRAACLGFATASMVLGVSAWHLSRTVQNITDTAMSSRTTDALAARSGPKFIDMLTRPTMTHVAFSPAAKDYDGKASAGLYVDTHTRTAYLVCSGMQVLGGSYRLIVDNGNGATRQIKEFEAGAGTFFIALDQVDISALKQLQIQAPQPNGARPETLLVASGV
ncbi:MAG: hypothetical protein JNK58_00395 [Phycisphaerae bacterium]|nr:hypothetical protein [Phycisphaerae bacterium]